MQLKRFLMEEDGVGVIEVVLILVVLADSTSPRTSDSTHISVRLRKTVISPRYLI